MHGLRFTTVVTTFISARRTLCMQVTMRSATTSLPAVACGTTGSSAGPIPPDDPCKRNISQIISCSTRRQSSVAGVIVKLRSDALRRYARSGSSRFVAPNQVPGENRITRLLVDRLELSSTQAPLYAARRSFLRFIHPEGRFLWTLFK
jgi:hypothetical protein